MILTTCRRGQSCSAMCFKKQGFQSLTPTETLMYLIQSGKLCEHQHDQIPIGDEIVNANAHQQEAAN
jgi:hypothetical protein